MRYPFTTDEFSEQVLSLYGCSVLEYIFRKVLLNQYLHLYFRVWRCIYHPELKIYLLFYFPDYSILFVVAFMPDTGVTSMARYCFIDKRETLGTATSLVVFVIVIVASSALFIMEANRSME